jgi:hypothetical protein
MGSPIGFFFIPDPTIEQETREQSMIRINFAQRTCTGTLPGKMAGDR